VGRDIEVGSFPWVRPGVCGVHDVLGRHLELLRETVEAEAIVRTIRIHQPERPLLSTLVVPGVRVQRRDPTWQVAGKWGRANQNGTKKRAAGCIDLVLAVRLRVEDPQ
jgi:hypothetical protein